MALSFSCNRVAVTGTSVGIASLAFNWITLRPNRLAAGTGVALWDSAGLAGTAIIVVPLSICLVLSLVGAGRRRAIVLGLTANFLIVASLALTGSVATGLAALGSPLSRVSLGPGLWVALAGASVIIFAARQQIKASLLWRSLVTWTSLSVLVALLFTGWFRNLSLLQELSGLQERFLQEVKQHIYLVSGGVAGGALTGIPMGIWANRSKYLEKPALFFANTVQTVPSLALFGFLIAPLSALSFAFPAARDLGIRGIGTTPAMVALVIYSLLPIVRNTYVGLQQIDPAVLDAGSGMGMSRSQILRRIELPLAAPIILEGMRTASIQAVGLAAVAALIGAGGLGWFIFQGIGQAASDLILLGAIPVIVLALAVDAIMRACGPLPLWSHPRA